MPKRPVEHILEEESKRYCRELFPPEMVVREKSDDYGIDLEVEIFEEGETTGLIFYVQLKATASKDIKQQQQISIRSETFNYWLELDCPTMVMRYCKNQDNPLVYWQWNYDYSARQTASGKSYIYEFSNADLWNKDTLKSAIKEFKNDRLINSPSLQTPVCIEMNSTAKKFLLEGTSGKL